MALFWFNGTCAHGLFQEPWFPAKINFAYLTIKLLKLSQLLSDGTDVRLYS
jgi:hypothetical protein